MLTFLIGLALLVGGYFTYGKVVETILRPDIRMAPAIKNADGVDYVILPQWKNMMIQLLNIAGIGPVIGVIIGIQFGDICFLIIPIGCVLAGATHDFLAGMMSLRDHGANLPKIIRDNLGLGYSKVFSWFTIILLLLVVAVFINVPAALCDTLVMPNTNAFWLFVGIIFAYYIAATLFPVDKIIGAIYPFFGALLLLGTFALFCVVLYKGFANPSILTETAAFQERMFTTENNHPIIPLLFVTIACGILSGFHGTQAPIVARTMKSEKEARATFYGMMIVEGIIAMIWAAGAMIVYNNMPELMGKNAQSVVLPKITEMLGSGMGTITVIAVIILAITSGDTALRSTRLSVAEMLHIPQSNLVTRVLTCLPLIAAITALLWWSNLSPKSFNNLWNYFAWGNQVLAASTLMAGAVWLGRRKKPTDIALIPGMLITFIVATYICWTDVKFGPPGLGLPLPYACAIGGAILLFVFIRIRFRISMTPPIKEKFYPRKIHKKSVKK